ncbi:mucin-5AC-like isoform X2, partial [Clarias magur]
IEISTNYRNKTCGLCGDFNGILQNEFIENGLCGNFNDMQGDDFKTHSGLIEGTSTSFASSWKVKLCQDFSATLSDPCSMSVEKEKYAKQWCEMLSDPTGDFSPCHFELNPKDYVMDYCGDSNSGSFRIITENIPCGTTGTTCSKSIKIFLGGTVCGLCGNYDGDWNNDFMTRGGEGVADPAEFGNSWRISTTCPEASGILSPCDMRPYRQAWAMKQCSILKSDVFSTCHSVVDPAQYYDACVRDTCACDAGGDSLFCDYYNNHEGCEWHYKPCGQSCMKTCKNPSGVCYSEIPPLE